MPEMVEMKAAGLTYADIAKKFGVTRQNIQQRLSPRLETMEAVSDRAQALCEDCGDFDQFGHYHHKVYDFDILNDPENIIYLCVKCHSRLNGEGHFCRDCGKQVFGFAGHSPRRYCNESCRAAYYSTTHECSNCHKTFLLNATQKIRIRRSKSGLIFCSKKCQGLYLAERHGFGVHPENAKYPRPPKWDYDSIWQKHLETGFGYRKLSRILNIPEGTITVFLTHKRKELLKTGNM